MRERPRRLIKFLGIALVAIASVRGPLAAQSGALPSTIGDQEFWRMVTEFSEAGGTFQGELMSNEDSAQFVIPALKETARRGGVYVGVGPEQNFTYIAAIQPRLAFVVDIRRDNMLEHLMYKALFELSSDRADFLSRLFSRRHPAGLDSNSSVTALFDAYRTVEAETSLYEQNLQAIWERLEREHRFPLTDADRAAVGRIFTAFSTAGPFALKGYGDTPNATFAQMMSATDLAGRTHGYLASEENFRTVRAIESENRLVPLVGDFAGEKALVSLGRYLRERGATVDVFYVSNVERYLFEQGEHGRRFYANLATLPLNQSSTFIRSVTSDISRRLGIPIPDGTTKWRSLLFPIGDCLKAFADGRLHAYRELFEIGR